MHIAEVAVPSGVDGRTTRRRTVNFAALARDAGTIVNVEVRDLSADGCRLTADTPFEPGTEIIIKLPQVGAYRARIAWSKGDEAGCEFASPLDPGIVEELSRAREKAARLALRTRRFGPCEGFR